jgi:hypothetical protein
MFLDKRLHIASYTSFYESKRTKPTWSNGQSGECSLELTETVAFMGFDLMVLFTFSSWMKQKKHKLRQTQSFSMENLNRKRKKVNFSLS